MYATALASPQTKSLYAIAKKKLHSLDHTISTNIELTVVLIGNSAVLSALFVPCSQFSGFI